MVLSNGDPKRTFLSMIDEQQVGAELVSHVRRLKTDVSYLKFHASLDELPDFTGYLGDRYDEDFLVQVRICPSVDYFQRSANDARAGKPSSAPVMHIQIPSVLDRSLVPEGKHVMSIWVLYAPVRPKQGTWDELREETGEHLIDVIEEYAPNFRKSVRDWGAVHAPGPGGACRADRRQHPAPRHHRGADAGQQARRTVLRIQDPGRQPLSVRCGRTPRGAKSPECPGTTRRTPFCVTGRCPRDLGPCEALCDRKWTLGCLNCRT